MVKCFAWLTHDIVHVTNLFILSTFVLAALGALAALRQMGVAYLPALAASILYSFMPYHFLSPDGASFTRQLLCRAAVVAAGAVGLRGARELALLVARTSLGFAGH